jgi:hypothetical protein
MSKILEDNPIFDEDYRYLPVVGDSVTYDTPILIKYNKDGSIDIKPICDLFNSAKATEFNEEQWRDFTKKNFKVLTRSGWKKVEYVYKHKTTKQLKRVTTKDGLIDCTIDHSLFDADKKEKKPGDFKKGDYIEIYTKPIKYNQANKIDIEMAWLYGFFMADGNAMVSEQKQTYFSKKEQEIRTYPNRKKYWKISNKSLERLNKAKEILIKHDYKCQIKDHMKSSSVYNLTCYDGKLIDNAISDFYTSYGYKKVPYAILNATKEIKSAFMDGFCCGDAQGDTLSECIEFGQKSKVAMAGIYFILKELNSNFRLRIRNDKPEFISFRFKNHRGKNIVDDLSERSHYKVWDVRDVVSKNEYVYDISCDGTFINVLGMITAHNTDGVNFLCAKKLRYTEEHPYYCTGKGRNGKVGKAYVGAEADVQEFEDVYLVPEIPGGYNKMGLDIDEVIPGNFLMRRKLYADLLDDGKIKRVGNSIKSRSMALYQKKFIMNGLKLLLYGHGKEFIDSYYDYIEKIFNFKIPLKDIASVGKIKMSLDEYKEKCKETTAAGSKKARQAWYELAIKEGLKVNMGDSIYYINTGKKKSDADVQRVTKYFIKQSDLFSENGEVDVTKEYTRELNKIKKLFKENPNNEAIQKYIRPNGKLVNLSDYVNMAHPEAEERDILNFNCILVPNDLIEDDEDHFCDENFEYNVEKYIDMLNKRILNLTVCFDRSMRERIDEKGKKVSNILITNPADRKEFTEEQCQLIYGQPLNESDQDKLEDVMMPEDKEIKFWLSINERPPYVDECGLDWDEITKDYLKRKEILQQEGIRDEVEKYNNFLENSLTKAMYDDFIDDGEIPTELSSFLEVETNGMNFISKKYNVVIGSLMDIIDMDFSLRNNGDDEEE